MTYGYGRIMEETTRFTFSPLSETESALLDDKGAELCRLPGMVLEKAFVLKDGRFLLVSTDDCPYEEGIHVTLLRPDGTIDERIDRLHAYHAAVLTEILPVSNDTLQITISDQERLQLVVDFDGHRKPLEFSNCGFKSDRNLFQHKYLSIAPANT